MNDDTISRRAAIDRINKQREHLQPDIYPQDKIGDAAYRICAEFIERLPSAQPEIEERTEEFAQNVPKEDLISRKAAIEAMSESLKRVFTEHRQIAEKCLKALPSAQPEPCDDAVSREAAIDAALSAFSRGLLASPDIRKLPSVQPEPQWIPVTERLPEELETVIITWKNHKPESYYSDIKDKPLTGVGIYHREKWWWWSAYAEDMLAEYGDSKADRMDEAIEVTAWMPLPEPYRAERRTDDLQ